MNLRKMWKIALKELKMTTANKAFTVITLIGPFLILGVTIVPGLVQQRIFQQQADQLDQRLAVVGPVASTKPLIPLLQERGLYVESHRARTGRLDQRVRDGDLYGLLLIPEQGVHADRLILLTTRFADVTLVRAVERIAGATFVEKRLSALGLDPSTVAELARPPTVQARTLDEAGGDSGQDLTALLFTVIAFVMLLYMTIIFYGQATGRAILTEKTSKTVEIMLSSVRPGELLFGKVLGKALAGVIQYAVWVAVALFLIQIVGPALGIQIPPTVTPVTLAYLVLFFILAFLMYSSAYAGVGATAQDEQNFTQLSWPIILFLIVPMVLISSVILSPDAPLVVTLSLFPLTAPIVMFARIVVSDPPAWHIGLSVALIIGTTGIIIAVSAKLFRVAILMAGGKRKLSDLFRFLRY